MSGYLGQSFFFFPFVKTMAGTHCLLFIPLKGLMFSSVHVWGFKAILHLTESLKQCRRPASGYGTMRRFLLSCSLSTRELVTTLCGFESLCTTFHWTNLSLSQDRKSCSTHASYLVHSHFRKYSWSFLFITQFCLASFPLVFGVGQSVVSSLQFEQAVIFI